MPIKIGDIVTCFDGSYSTCFCEKLNRYIYANAAHPKGRKYKVLAIDYDLPNYELQVYIQKQTNDTIIQEISTGKVIFVQQRFLKKEEEFHVTDTVLVNSEMKMICGRVQGVYENTVDVLININKKDISQP